MGYDRLIKEVEEHVSNFFSQNDGSELLYHNLQHTNLVVKAIEELSTHYKLNEEENFIVTCAAWFHDIGYFSNPENHEEIGAKAASAFLREKGVETSTIDTIYNCIISTKLPQQPFDLLSEIVCDADMFHFASREFDHNCKQLRKELELRSGTKIKKEDWQRQTLLLLNSHQYFTDYGRNCWASEKEKNVKAMNEKSAGGKLAAASDKKKVDGVRPDRGIETMFRITSTNNQRLSDMADKKADILITVNSILLSVVIGVLIRKLESSLHLVIPTIIILTTSLITMVFAIIATRPKIPDGVFTKEDVEKKSVNLLFFGNFYKTGFDEYKLGMQKVMNDREFLYGSLVKDVYSQGIVLGRKYKLLRVAYNVFMFGLIAAVFAFTIATFMVI